MCTAPSESIDTPRLLSHFVVLQPEFKMDYIEIFFVTDQHKIPHNDKVKTCLQNFLQIN